ncbi:MAG: TMEM165/GDT1 family protein [Tissierellales bacterium]
MIQELLKAFLFIFVAEMGDKTQILAMTFATQYKVRKVLLGVLIGSALNHGIAIALGSYLSNIIPLDKIQLAAGIMFVIFGLWALKSDDEEDKGNKKCFNPVITVAIAFFLGELGDKTQLTAMTLGTDASYPLFILIGTVLGMLATSSLGIFVGSIIGDKMPEIALKIASSTVFLFFGTLKLYQTLPSSYITVLNTIIYFVFLSIPVYFLLKLNFKAKKSGKRLPMQEAAATLYIQANEIKKAVEDICLGEAKCGSCVGSNCLIGFTKRALKSATEEGIFILPSEWEELPKYNPKSFEQGKVIEALGLTIWHIIKYGNSIDENYVVNKVRQALETIALGETIPFDGDIKKYYKIMKEKNESMYEKIKKKVWDLEHEIN